MNLSQVWLELKYYDCPLSFDQFSNLLLRDIIPVCRDIHKHYQVRINVNSFSNSQVAHLLYQFGMGFSGGKAKRKVTHASFLPFVIEAETTDGINRQVKEICDRLIKEQKLSIKLTSIVANSK